MSNSYAQYVNNTYLICEKKLPAAKPDEAEKSGARVPPSDPALLRPLVLSVSPTAHGFLTVLFPSDYYIPACWRSVSRREASFLTKKRAGRFSFAGSCDLRRRACGGRGPVPFRNLCLVREIATATLQGFLAAILQDVRRQLRGSLKQFVLPSSLLQAKKSSGPKDLSL